MSFVPQQETEPMRIVDRDVVLSFGRCKQQQVRHVYPSPRYASSLLLEYSVQVFMLNGCRRLGIERSL